MSFPLHRLPGLAFIEVVRCMNLLEVFYLTQTSLKTWQLLKRNIKLPIDLIINFEMFKDDMSFKFHGHRNEEYVTLLVTQRCPPAHVNPLYWKFGKSRESWSNRIIYTMGANWEDRIHGYKVMIDFLKNTFNIKFTQFKNSGDKIAEENPFQLIGNCMDNGLKIDDLEWRFDPIAPEGFDFSRFDGYSMDQLTLFRARNITIDHLVSWMNIPNAYIHGTRFSLERIGELLKRLTEVNFGSISFWMIINALPFMDIAALMNTLKLEKVNDETWMVKQLDGFRIEVNVTMRRVRFTRIRTYDL